MSKIVVVDDEKFFTSSIKLFLKVRGFEDVDCFNKPKEAIDFLKHNKPDIIISDFNMPDMNGLEFLTQAKKLYPEISMILLTGYADKENAIKAINDVGIYKYIEKPWDEESMILDIKNGIERGYLLENLRDKIIQLEDANTKLEEYSEKLEQMVAARTEELRDANAKLNGIINCCADGIIIIDRLGIIEQVNPACENMTGLSEVALCHMKLQEIAYSDNVDFNKSAKNKEGIFGLGPDKSEILIRDCYIRNSLSDKRIPVEINFASISTSEKERYVGVIRDVSLQKDTERLRDDFIATLTHDLRTPLTAAINALNILLDGSLGELEEKQKVLLSTMKNSNEDLLGLVNALLEVYRFESGKLELYKTDFNIKELVETCYNELKLLAEKKDIEFVLNCETDDYICADRAEIKRVIINLCGNAVNYTNKGGKIEIFAKSIEGDFIFSVSDNGNGIPKEDIPNLFMRFSQGTTKKRSTGTGLGLYLSRQIIEAHGGKIQVESKMNKGSEFTFLLPGVVVKKKVEV